MKVWMPIIVMLSISNAVFAGQSKFAGCVGTADSKWLPTGKDAAKIQCIIDNRQSLSAADCMTVANSLSLFGNREIAKGQCLQLPSISSAECTAIASSLASAMSQERAHMYCFQKVN